jgi:hypothetical protein
LHCPTELLPIYQNKHWTIRQWDDRSVDPSSHHIILKIVEFHFTTPDSNCVLLKLDELLGFILTKMVLETPIKHCVIGPRENVPLQKW